MLIGQDLLNRFILMHPYQPTFRIPPHLSITRTKLGLVLSGYLNVKEFSEWTLAEAEAKRMKETLYPELSHQKSPPKEDALSSLRTKLNIEKELQFKMGHYGKGINLLTEYFCKSMMNYV